MVNSFRPADKLTLSFLVVLGILALVGGAVSTGKLLVIYAALALLVICSVLYRKTDPDGNKAFYFSTMATVITIIFIFNSLGTLIAEVHPRRYDRLLIALDYAIFGHHPTVWMERFITTGRTAFLQIAYISYYFMPIALAITLIGRSRHAEFEEAWFGIVLCFYLSYLGYLLVPAVGPRFTLEALQTKQLNAGPLITAVQDALNRLEQNKTDAFPSGHTAIALVSLYYAGKTGERVLFGLLLPMVLALIVSTVYLRYHYAVDVIAGVLLAAVTVLLAPRCERLLSGGSDQS
jgi:membrane-associated phospholipid phosphatase